MDQKISQIVMFIIAAVLVLSVALVLLTKGISAVPHEWLGVGITAMLAVAALAMTRLNFGPGH